MTARLSSAAADLVALIERQTAEGRRQVAVAVSSWIVGPADARVTAALTQLRRLRTGSAPERDAVRQLVDELDALAWNLNDRVEDGGAPREDHLAAFARARAASAVWFASDEDPSTAALGAAYEAQAATGDLDGARRLVSSVGS